MKKLVESQTVELKQSWREEYFKWVSGFANAQGGKLYVGVRDDGSICGVENPKKLMEDIPNQMRDGLGMIADVNLRNMGGKSVIEIDVPEYPMGVPYHGVIGNAGILPDDWTAATLMGKHNSRPYNPTLASCVYLTGMIETWGRGIEKVRAASVAHGCGDLSYDVHGRDLLVKIPAAFKVEGTSIETVPQDLTKNIGHKRISVTKEHRSQKRPPLALGEIKAMKSLAL